MQEIIRTDIINNETKRALFFVDFKPLLDVLNLQFDFVNQYFQQSNAWSLMSTPNYLQVKLLPRTCTNSINFLSIHEHRFSPCTHAAPPLPGRRPFPCGWCTGGRGRHRTSGRRRPKEIPCDILCYRISHKFNLTFSMKGPKIIDQGIENKKWAFCTFGIFSLYRCLYSRKNFVFWGLKQN